MDHPKNNSNFFSCEGIASMQWIGNRGAQEDTFVVGEIDGDSTVSTDGIMSSLRTKMISFNDPDDSGSTAVVVMAKPNGDLQVSHLGDSAVCLINVLDNGEFTFELLTKNIHNCSNNKEWVKLDELDGCLSTLAGRRLGPINLSRCFGQKYSIFLRKDSDKKVEDLVGFCTTHETAVISGSSLPQVQRRFVLVFSDGLYCTLDNKAGVDYYTVNNVLPQAIQDVIRDNAKAAIKDIATEMDAKHKLLMEKGFDNNTFIILDVTTPPKKSIVAAVFDGNCGKNCSEFLASQVASMIQKDKGQVIASQATFSNADLLPESFNRYMLSHGSTLFLTSIQDMSLRDSAQMRFKSFVKYTVEELAKHFTCNESDMVGFNVPKDADYYVELYFASSSTFAHALLRHLKKNRMVDREKEVGEKLILKDDKEYIYPCLKMDKNEMMAYLNWINADVQEFDKIVVQGKPSNTSIDDYQRKELERRQQKANTKSSGVNM